MTRKPAFTRSVLGKPISHAKAYKPHETYKAHYANHM